MDDPFATYERRFTQQGQYPVELLVPPWSRLTSADITTILDLASWQEDPNGAEGVSLSGGRGLRVPRNHSIEDRGVPLPYLEISGIGYKPSVPVTGPFFLTDNSQPFLPPSGTNYMDVIPPDKLVSQHFANGQLVTDRAPYAPAGAYTFPSIVNKARKTMEAYRWKLDTCAVPFIEAAGLHRASHLSDADGPFGFLVYPTPGPDRLAQTITRRFLDASPRTVRHAFELFVDLAAEYLFPLEEALRELHDRQRRAHLQPHLHNVYFVSDSAQKIYLVDWGTATPIGDGRDAIRNRIVDAKKPTDNLTTVFSALTGTQGEPVNYLSLTMIDLALRAYIGVRGGKLNVLASHKRAVQSSGGAGDTDGMFQCLMDFGFEGYRAIPHTEDTAEMLSETLMKPRVHVTSRASGKTGRNVPCPCGSGHKYKKCCGDH